MVRPSGTAFTGSRFTAALLTLVGLPCLGQSGSNLRVMPMGDSITAGYLSTTNNGYRGPLAAALAGQVGVLDLVGTQLAGTMSDPDNEGHSGYEIAQVAALANNSVKNYKPNVVLLDLGINDLRLNDDISAAPSRLGSLIDQILSDEPDATVLVAQLIINTNATVESRREAFNNELPAIVRARTDQGKHVALVDTSALTIADLADGLHPNDTGYQLLANAWDKAILQAIANKWIADPVAGSASRPTGTVFSGIAGKCLDDLNGSGSAGTKADLYSCNGSAAQQWNVNNGRLAINGLCLDVDGGGTANGTAVDLYSCTGASNQMWTVKNGTLVNPASGLCLTDPNGSTAAGTQLAIETCTGSADQQWRVPSEGPVLSGIADKCLDAFGGAAVNGTKADSYSCNQTAAQQWQVKNNTLVFDGKCLDVKGGGTASGTKVQLYACNGGANQIWIPENGALVNPASGRCLDIPGGTTADETQLDIWDCSGGSNQQWTLPPGTSQS